MNLFKKYNLLFFGLLISIIVGGQEKIILKGNIRDINGNPISNANIKAITNDIEEKVLDYENNKKSLLDSI